jgi:hypothetical protein
MYCRDCDPTDFLAKQEQEMEKNKHHKYMLRKEEDGSIKYGDQAVWIEWNEDRPYILKGTIPNIKLSIGRSRWDYVYAKSFKVLKTNKYKTTLEVTLGDNRIVEYRVSAKSFDNFIEQIYAWQTSVAEKHNDKMTEKFNNQYASKKAV